MWFQTFADINQDEKALGEIRNRVIATVKRIMKRNASSAVGDNAYEYMKRFQENEDDYDVWLEESFEDEYREDDKKVFSLACDAISEDDLKTLLKTGTFDSYISTLLRCIPVDEGIQTAAATYTEVCSRRPVNKRKKTAASKEEYLRWYDERDIALDELHSVLFSRAKVLLPNVKYG